MLIEHVKLTIYPGDRIALLGRNGAGKSTTMKLLAGELTSPVGERIEARDLALGYVAQHQLEQLSADENVLMNLRRGGGAMRASEQELRDFLAGFGFRGERVSSACAPCPAARRRGSRSRSWRIGGRTCCCSTSPPTTWTWRCARRSQWRCRSTTARW